MKPRRASEYTGSLVVHLLPKDTNAYGHIFGGAVMSLMDQAAGVVAMRYSDSRVVTASAEEITFCTPILLGEVLEAKSKIIYTGNTSMDLEVKVYAENIPEHTHRVAAKGYFTMVAVDDGGKPSPIPPIRPETEEEQRKYAKAEKRRIAKGLIKK